MFKMMLAASALAVTVAVKWPQQIQTTAPENVPLGMPPDQRQAVNTFAITPPAGVPASFSVTYTGPEFTYLAPPNPILQMGPSITYSDTAVFMGDPNAVGNPAAFALPGTHWYWQTTGGLTGNPFVIYMDRRNGAVWVQCGTRSCCTQGSVGALREFWYGIISVR